VSYKLLIAKDVVAFLKYQQKSIIQKSLMAFDDIANNPFDNRYDIKKMQGYTNHYRLRLGKIRFLYEVKEQEILIFFYKSGYRGDIYK